MITNRKQVLIIFGSDLWTCRSSLPNLNSLLYNGQLLNLLIVMDALTLLLSVATESQSNKSPLREVSCTTQVCKKYPLSRLRQILLARDFRSTAKCQYMKNEILIVTRDLGKNGGVWEAIVNKTVRGLGLCVFQQRFAMHWTLALFLASVFCSLYCWTISTKQRKELVSRDNHLTFCQIWYLEHYAIFLLTIYESFACQGI